MHEIIWNPPTVCMRCHLPGDVLEDAFTGRLLCRGCLPVLCLGCERTVLGMEMFDGRCLKCQEPEIPAPLQQDYTPEIDEETGELTGRVIGPLPAPLQQSEADRLHDEIVEATRQVNEMCDRLDDLIEQHRLALGKEVELAPPLNKHGLWGYDVRVEEGEDA